MKNQIKKIAILALLAISFASCDSTSDPITTAVTPSTFEYLSINSTNAAIGNQCNIWDFKRMTTVGMNTSVVERTDNFSPSLLTQTTMLNQCSAYCKDLIQGAKRYVVSTGERVVVYNASATTTPAPTVFPFSGVQAMEFVNGRFFMIKNHILKEYDIFTLNPITTFTPINLTPTAGVSNLTFDGNYLYVISSGNLFKIDTTGSGAVASGYPMVVTSNRYEGLEFINSAGCPNSLYAVERTTSGNNLVKINPATGVPTSVISGLTFVSDFSKISSALDYNTEFYYLRSSNGAASNTHTFTIIDLTPAAGSVVANPLTVTGYEFGLQLKD
jgi:hypothetical protein